jgi:putative phage-type endonuclease
MTSKIHDVVQGSPEWLALRAPYYTASEVPAMMGVSKYQTRSDLLKRKATGIADEIEPAKQTLFDRGHEAERLARPIVEEMIGEELFPATVTREVDGLPLLASLDGITMDGTVIWETKLLNASLQDAIAMSELDLHYFYQIEQQLLVTGAEKCYFTASDGTEEGTFGMWIESSPELRAKLIAGWKRFDEDLKNYQHTEHVAVPVADAIEDLPALTVQLVGQVTSSNLATFQTAVLERIKAINTTLVTDADFANADKMVKFLDDGEKRLDLVKAQALAQTESIDKLFRTIDSLKAEMRSKRLTLDKLVKAEKENRKTEIVGAANKELSAHIVALQGRVGVLVNVPGNFGEAIKGLKSLDSMRDRVSVALENAKIEASQIADRIEANRKTVEDMSLFPDFAQVCTKPVDDFAALLAMRVAQRKESEEKRLADEREKIRAEEQEKARTEISHVIGSNKSVPQVSTVPATAKDSMTVGSTIKLGEICTRLGFTVTSDFMAHIGFPFVAHDKNAKLYRASDFPDMCEAIAAHCLKAGRLAQKAA